MEEQQGTCSCTSLICALNTLAYFQKYNTTLPQTAGSPASRQVTYTNIHLTNTDVKCRPRAEEKQGGSGV